MPLVRLLDIDARIHDEGSGTLNLTPEVGLVVIDLLYRHGDNRIQDIAG